MYTPLFSGRGPRRIPVISRTYGVVLRTARYEELRIRGGIEEKRWGFEFKVEFWEIVPKEMLREKDMGRGGICRIIGEE